MARNWVKRAPSLRWGWDPGWHHLPIRKLEGKTEDMCHSVHHCGCLTAQVGMQWDIYSSWTGVICVDCYVTSQNIKCFRQFIFNNIPVCFWDTSRIFLPPPGLAREPPPVPHLPVEAPAPIPPDAEGAGPSPPDSQEPQAASAPLASFQLGRKKKRCMQ